MTAIEKFCCVVFQKQALTGTLKLATLKTNRKMRITFLKFHMIFGPKLFKDKQKISKVEG